jgi:hypothetical protein
MAFKVAENSPVLLCLIMSNFVIPAKNLHLNTICGSGDEIREDKNEKLP